MFPKLPQISLFYDGTIIVQRLAVSGVLRYANTCSPWCVTLNEAHAKPSVPTDCSGIIACAPHARDLKMLMRLNLPMVIVNLSHLTSEERALVQDIPHIESDTRAFGVMGAEFFLNHPPRTFVYVGHPDPRPWDLDREGAFVRRLEAAGERARVYPRPTARLSPTNEQIRLRDWLAQLPRPLSILAASDARARQTLNACILANISVPYEAAILGVDDDEWICESTRPRLSSIASNAEIGGFEAAQSLDQLMRRRTDPAAPPPPRVKLLPPRKVVARESTDFRTVSNPAVSKALSFIHLNKGLNIRVSDVAAYIDLSPDWAEALFRHELGTTIINEIASVRMKTVVELIRTTDTPFGKIAERCGFTNASTLCRLVKKATGKTMTDLRRA